jgi:hypothetical protein
MKKNKLFVCAFAVVTMLAVSCSKDDESPAGAVINTVTIKNLDADAAATGHFTFFRLSDSTIVPLADSASTKWDIGFNATSIIVNSGINGPGTATAQLVTGTYASLTAAPATGYLKDSAGGRAIGAWYIYNGATHIISPNTAKTIVVKTNSNKYAKIMVTSYYKNAPAAPDAFTDLARYYTFQYTIQQNGTTSFQ